MAWEVQICDRLLGIIRGVQHIHSKGMVHRDLKPQNAFDCDDVSKPLSKIADFGESRTEDTDLTMTCRHEVLHAS